MRQFDFGENWSEFSANALNAEKVRQAREEFADLLRRGSVELEGRSFLDIGFGQGLSVLSAAVAGANAVGCDINPKCAEVLERNRVLFPAAGSISIPVVVGSILEPATVQALRRMRAGTKLCIPGASCTIRAGCGRPSMLRPRSCVPEGRSSWRSITGIGARQPGP